MCRIAAKRSGVPDRESRNNAPPLLAPLRMGTQETAGKLNLNRVVGTHFAAGAN